MSQTLFFYDLETSGVNPRKDRVMQFGGQRTDMDLKPIGDPVNILIKLTEDILPDPEAILVTGITPQMTLSAGISEAQFARLFYKEIAIPDTIFVGFNSIRFDDEFMRFLFWRNFHDPYEWQWKNGCSRWDILDLSRMTRALRPEGIKWPFDSSGKPTNRLEYLASVNNLSHEDAHDALGDVNATIAVARLIKEKQPKLFNYLLSKRNKKDIEKFTAQKTFVYSSGKYPGEVEKTAVVQNIGHHPDKNGALVFDLRYDPDEYTSLTPEEIVKLWRYDPEKKLVPLPVKSLQFNRCPAIAPLSVLDKKCYKRLGINEEIIEKNKEKLQTSKNFVKKLYEALEIINSERSKGQTELLVDELSVDGQLYSGFVPDADRKQYPSIHQAKPNELNLFVEKFSDERLKLMLPLYKARNFANSLSNAEKKRWDEYRVRLLTSGGDSSRFSVWSSRLEMINDSGKLRDKDRFTLDELELWAQRILPKSV